MSSDTTIPVKYIRRNHPRLQDIAIADCYLCGEALGGDSRSDHLIPNSLFRAGSPSRPQLPVHHDCNNSKSIEDEWFLRHMQLASAINPDALTEIQRFLDKGLAEKQDAFLIGRSASVRNYRKAVSLLDKTTWGLQVQLQGETRHLLHVGSENSKRAGEYVKTMCRGLYIRNVTGARPDTPQLMGIQYAHASTSNLYTTFTDTVDRLIQGSTTSGFFQSWQGTVTYYGSRIKETPHKGFLFIEFYGQVGYLASFL